jgi:hypothetical protein
MKPNRQEALDDILHSTGMTSFILCSQDDGVRQSAVCVFIISSPLTTRTVQQMLDDLRDGLTYAFAIRNSDFPSER